MTDVGTSQKKRTAVPLPAEKIAADGRSKVGDLRIIVVCDISGPSVEYKTSDFAIKETEENSRYSILLMMVCVLLRELQDY